MNHVNKKGDRTIQNKALNMWTKLIKKVMGRKEDNSKL
jgi:hypothetical protein